MNIRDSWRVLLTVILAQLLVACSGQRVLMPTPNIHVGSENEIYTGLPGELKTNEIPLFYITDRMPEKDENGMLEYGYQRSQNQYCCAQPGNRCRG